MASLISSNMSGTKKTAIHSPFETVRAVTRHGLCQDRCRSIESIAARMIDCSNTEVNCQSSIQLNSDTEQLQTNAAVLKPPPY